MRRVVSRGKSSPRQKRSARSSSRVETSVHVLKKGPVPKAALRETVESLDDGELVIFPTDTVYGLAASVFRPKAIERVFEIKNRPADRLLPYLIADLAHARPLVEHIVPRLERLLRAYWPGPLTVVFKASALGRWVAGGKDTIALRVPDHPAALALLREIKKPLAVTSVNISGRKPAVTGRECLRVFRGKVRMVWDGGRCPVGKASTVLDAAGAHWTLIREGAVPKKALEAYLV